MYAALQNRNPVQELGLVVDENEIDHGPDENATEEAITARIGAEALARWDARAVPPPDWQVDVDARIAAWRALFAQGGVLALTRELAVVHARENIRVNALCPGPLRTELLMKFLDTEAKKQRRLVHVPMGRFGEAAEMAKAALFLASDESSYMTGTEFAVDGGITAAYVTPE